MIQSQDSPTLPPEVRRFMRRFVQRQRRLALLKAIGGAIAFAVTWMLAVCALDRLAPLPGSLRLALLVIDGVGIAILLARPLLSAITSRIDFVQAASLIESRESGFAQRLQTLTSQLLAKPEHRGSAEILDYLAQEVTHHAAAEMPGRLIPWRLALRPWIAAVFLVILTIALMPLPWLDLPTLMARMFRPMSSIAPVTTTRLHVSPGDADIPQGEPLIVTVDCERLGDSTVQLHLASPTGVWSQLAMTPQADDRDSSARYTYSLSALDHDVRYYVTGGDAASETFTARALRKPGVAEFRIRYVYPSYTGRQPLVVSNTDGLIEAPVGTEASLSVTSTEPLSDAVLIFNKDPRSTDSRPADRIQMTPTIDDRVRQAKLLVTRDQTYQLELVSRNVRGSGPGVMTIRAIPDRAPLPRLLQPAEDLRLSPHDILPVQYEALDDYGIASVTLLVQIDSSGVRGKGPTTRAQNSQRHALSLGGDPHRQLGETAVDLATLHVQIGDLVSLAIEASDRGGQKSVSEWRHVLVSPRSIDINTHLRIAELRQAEELAKSLGKELDAASQSLSAPESLASFKIDQSIAASSDDASLLRQRLLRTIIHSRGPAFSDAVAALVDSSQIVSNLTDEISQVLAGDRNSQRIRDRLAKAGAEAKQIQQRISILADGEQAAATQGERNNLLASEKPAGSGKSGSDGRRQALARARADVRADLADLGLNPDAADIDAQLLSRIASAETLIQSLKPIDFAAASSAWAAIVVKKQNWQSRLDDRLAAASKAEAVRPDADMVAARDLQLSSRAADRLASDAAVPGAATQPVVSADLGEYPAAMGALQREHRLSRTAAPPTPPPQAARIHADAEVARRKMAQWAGDTQSAESLAATQALPATQPSPEELAIQASAEAQKLQFTESDKLDRAMSPQDREQVAQAMKRAQQLGQITQTQEQLAAETAQAKPDQAQALAERQQQVAQAIEKVRQEQPDAAGEQEPNTREEALSAIRDAQAALAEMPQQLTAAQEAAATRRAASARASAAKNDAASATPDRQAAAQRAADQADRDAAEAAQRLDQAEKPVNPDVSEALSAKLSRSAPETSEAAEAVGQQLSPALRQLDQSIKAQDAAGVERASASARQAIEQAQKALREAQERVSERDPILAAKAFAREAAAALSRQPANLKAAKPHQQKVVQSLAQAQNKSLQQAKGKRLAQTPGYSSLYGADIGTKGGEVPGLDGAAPGLTGSRQWGKLRAREPGEVNSASSAVDPPGYHEALRAYFEALGKGQQGEEKK